MKLIDNWKSFWRWNSTWITALILAVPFAWAEMPPDIKSYIPESWEPFIAAGAFAAFLFGRLRKQGGDDA